MSPRGCCGCCGCCAASLTYSGYLPGSTQRETSNVQTLHASSNARVSRDAAPMRHDELTGEHVDMGWGHGDG